MSWPTGSELHNYGGWCLSCDLPWTSEHDHRSSVDIPVEVPWDALRELARRMASRAYAPYSKFHVGAALMCADGQTFVGVNVENGAYTGTHAEQAAIAAWVAAGRPSTPVAVTSVALPSDQVHTSCGMCRQHLAELCGITVLIDDRAGPVSLDTMLPGWFAPEVLPDGIGPAYATDRDSNSAS